MHLTAAQRRALEAICDTFCPQSAGLPTARELGVADAMADAIGAARPAERRQVAGLLRLWDTRLLTALGGGGGRHFSDLPAAAREHVLTNWGDSRLAQRRAVFQALRKGSLLFYYALAGPGGSRNPVWDSIGYPGPLGINPAAQPKALRPVGIERDTVLDCDVVVVGSGAGGGVSAGVLAQAGLDVVVLESGGYYDDEDFDGAEFSALTRLYAAAPSATADQSVSLVAGSCLGGGTVVNYTTSFRTPDSVRAEWASHGVREFAGDEFSSSLDAVWERLGVNRDHHEASTRDQLMEKACRSLGWHVDSMPRDVRGCDTGVECGFCGFGCRIGAKQSTAKTWLVDASSAGARLVVRTKAERVIVRNGVAQGVDACTQDGHRVTVRARAVVVAAGAIQTPALLKRSGLANKNLGRHLKLHPAAAVMGIFDEEIRPWEGAMQARYSDELSNLDNGYGVKFESAPLQPHLILTFLPWRDCQRHHDLMRQLPNTSVIGALLRDRDGGEVRVDRQGEPVVHYRLSDYDRDHLRAGVRGAAHILEAAGARRIYSSHCRFVSYEPGRRGTLDEFAQDADRAGYRAGEVVLGSFHIMGSARMGGSPADSACNPQGETWDVRNLYVSDGSSFPTASGVNPMISIEAVAHLNAKRLAAALT